METRLNSRSAMRTLVGAAVCAVLAAATGCRPSTGRSDSLASPDPDAVVESLERSGSRENSVGVDLWEVALCRIPERYDDALYDMDGVRLEKSAEAIADELKPVTDYFQQLSSGQYVVHFRPALGDLRPDFGSAQACIDAALEQSSSDADGVLVIADAQHDETRLGGWGSAGGHCRAQCGAFESRRMIYMGAADFVRPSASWLDLVEHEMGHALGWPHSSRFADYDSALDVMSDSSAGRRASEARVHAPGALAVNRHLSGWTAASPVVLGAQEQSSAEVTSDVFAIVVVSRYSVLTVEMIENDGEYDHLVASGIAVHLVEWGPEACELPMATRGETEKICAGASRFHRVIGPDSSADGLMRVGDRIEFEGIEVAVDSIVQRVDGSTASIRVAPG